MVSVENSFRERYESYARVMWEVDSLGKCVKCDGVVTVVRVTRDEKESRMFRGKHELCSKSYVVIPDRARGIYVKTWSLD